MKKEEVLELVRKRLKDQPLEGITIEALDEGITQEGDYWYIPIVPSVQPRHTFAYYDALAEVETYLSMDDDVKVLLIPTLPESYIAEGEAKQREIDAAKAKQKELDREIETAKMKVSGT